MLTNRLFFLLIPILILIHATSWAGDIEKGTVTVGAASNAAFSLVDREDSDNYGSLQLDSEMGYFLFKNLEVGAGLSLQFTESKQSDAQGYTLAPYLAYHWPLSETTSFYSRFSVGYGHSSTNHDEVEMESESTFTAMALEVGYEYFLNRNISIGAGLIGAQHRYEHEWRYSDNENDSTTTINQLTAALKFKLYF